MEYYRSFQVVLLKLPRQRKTENQAKYVRKTSFETILVGEKDEADSSEMKGREFEAWTESGEEY